MDVFIKGEKRSLNRHVYFLQSYVVQVEDD